MLRWPAEERRRIIFSLCPVGVRWVLAPIWWYEIPVYLLILTAGALFAWNPSPNYLDIIQAVANTRNLNLISESLASSLLL
jgi:hypothetical protein